MPDWIGHAVADGVGFISVAIALYVSYRIAVLKEWFRIEMTAVVKENCAGKVEFDGHVKADEHFQRTLLEDISVKRGEYARQHRDHYDHAARSAIHQESMSVDLQKEKFENLKVQVAGVTERMDRLADALERRP